MSDQRIIKVNEDEELIIVDDDETMYTTCPELVLHVQNDRKRKITIISDDNQEYDEEDEVEDYPPRRSRRSEADLRRRAILNNASRSRSRKRPDSWADSVSGSRSRPRSTSRSVARPARDESRSRSRSRAIMPATSDEPRCRSRSRKPAKRALTFPTNDQMAELRDRCRVSRPECISLPSPLHILTEQQVTGVAEAKTIQFLTRIILTTKKLSLEDRGELYEEMIEACRGNIGTSRSSIDINDDEKEDEDYSSRIFYSDKGVLIETVQMVRKVGSGKVTTTSEEKFYSDICKTRIIGDQGKFLDGSLNIKCSEKIETRRQTYSRFEKFVIGLKNDQAEGKFEIASEKKTFDPTKTINFEEKVMFDRENVGILIDHKATAEMAQHWNHDQGSFGEQHCDYREIKFIFALPDSKSQQQQKPKQKKRIATPAIRQHAPKRQNDDVKTALAATPRSNDTGCSFLQSSPQATSTPKSPCLLRPTSARAMLTPVKNGTPQQTSPAPKISPNEVDVDKSLRKPATRNLDALFERVRRSKTPPQNDMRTALEITPDNKKPDSNENSSSSDISLLRPRGKLRIKETKITREILEREGQPPQVNEKKEETVKEQDVSMHAKRPRKKRSRSRAPKIVLPDSTRSTPEKSMKIDLPPIDVPNENGQKQDFIEPIEVDLIADGVKHNCVFNVVFRSVKKPDVELNSIKFRGTSVWEKSQEWNSMSTRTSNTKTLAVQQSDIMKDEKK